MRGIKIWIGMLAMVTGCMRAPLLVNAPRPDPAVVAGLSAATAGLLALANPEALQKRIERAYLDAMPEERPMRVTEVVNAEVLDRLDATKRVSVDWSAL